MYELRAKLADVPVLIRCRFEKNRNYFRDYLCEEDPRICVQPTDADLERIRSSLEPTCETDSDTASPLKDVFLENLAIHSLLSEKLVAENVLLMHGSAVCMDGETVIFTAKSGTGKSTHAKLWREVFGERVIMINDDKPFLRIDGGVTVYGSPWGGKHRLSRNISAPLKAIVKLERDAENRIEPMSRADAFPVLMEQSFSSKDPATRIRIFKLENELLSAVAFYDLKCNMDPEAARVACEGIFGPHENI